MHIQNRYSIHSVIFPAIYICHISCISKSCATRDPISEHIILPCIQSNSTRSQHYQITATEIIPQYNISSKPKSHLIIVCSVLIPIAQITWRDAAQIHLTWKLHTLLLRRKSELVNFQVRLIVFV